MLVVLGLGKFEWAEEHFVEAEAVGAVFFDYFIWINDVVFRLGTNLRLSTILLAPRQFDFTY